MKLLAISIAATLAATVARADLVMAQAIVETNSVSRVVLKLHDGKMRMDERDPGGQYFSAVVDLHTRDSLTLFHFGKTFLKRSGAEARRQIETEIAAAHGTNQMFDAPAPPTDTGQSAKVNGFDTEIYRWSGAHGMTETLWVATNYPDYAAIRTYLSQIDKFNAAGAHRNAQPAAGLLPGMIVKSERDVNGHAVTTTLISAKVEPVDAFLFELPSDYSPWQPPTIIVTTGTNPVAPGQIHQQPKHKEIPAK